MKKIDDDVTSVIFDVIIFFPIYGQFAAIRKPDFGRAVYKKMLIFRKKNTDISKTKGVLVLKGIFSETKYVRVLTYQISSFYINSNEFWDGVILPRHHPHSATQNEALKTHPN